MTQVQAPPRIAVPPFIDPAMLETFDPGAPVVRLGGDTMGTTWHVLAVVPARQHIPVAELERRITARLAAITCQMSHWDKGSLLSLFNHAPAGTLYPLPHDFNAVVACGLQIAADSEGAFDPAIGRLTDLWGLGPNPASDPPDAAAVRTAQAVSGWRRLGYDSEAPALLQPGGVWLDLSGIAKGYAVDAITDLLGDLGVHHALVEIGGECRGRGMRPDGDPWWVDMESPPACRLPPLRIALHELAIATSGDYLRGAHTLDPRDGLPVRHGATTVSVVHSACMVADAWATALGVAPLPHAQALARKHGLAVRFVSRSGDEWFSPALQAML
ncbi:FAD:protein FMN transferase [Erythrobacter sp. T5W1-R]|uniref:FAD:protein FMN transferase n=1 Tax=Erythrobacter sp. T5W1-R TaxID=3101752 RepID=UPI002AFEE30F|nr:FAD:protein FMN transferase [Erythrobacter sp. T5W1-R]MEA1618610.1 FAD:protein FMN transferase [Erythrobacter sp. T5W1-R]